MSPRVLFFDIETAPNLAYVWGHFDQNVIEHRQEWYILCFAYKWQGEAKIHTVSQIDFWEDFERDPCDDSAVVGELWRVFDEADVVIAHNGDRFDVPKANARFAQLNLGAPSAFRTIDTRKVASRHFKFNSNSLDNLGESLGLGRKVKHDGFEMWQGCMAGDAKHWRNMLKYNRQDIRLLEKVYERLRPFISNHPNFANWDPHVCPTCGANPEHLQRRGMVHTQTQTFQQWHCQICSSYSRSRTATPTKRPHRTALTRR